MPESNQATHQAMGISIREVSVAFEAGKAVLDKLSIEIQPGEILALLGSSGCGKSTLLRSIANLRPPNSGTIDFVGASLSRRTTDLSYVFQDPTLLPWRTVEGNVRLPFELGRSRTGQRGVDELIRDDSARKRHLQTVLNSVGLSPDTHSKFPRELSGGMKMRTSIARALVTDPNILLLDEPFAALDDLLRTRMNELVWDLWQQRRRTIVFVTHNIAEAVYLSHRIAVLGKGKVSKLIENTLPTPRTSIQRTSLAFAELYGSVSAALAEASL